MKLKIATEPVFDPYGGLFWHTQRLVKYSRHQIKPVPSAFLRFLLNRQKKLKTYLFQEISLKRFDVIHSRSLPWFIKACRRSRSSRTKWVHSIHGLFYEADYPHGLKDWQIIQNQAVLDAAREADKVVTVAHWLKQSLWQDYGIQSSVVTNGVDFRQIDHVNPKRFCTRMKIQAPFVFFSGSFREVKFPLRVIDIAWRLPDTIFVISGDGLTPNELTSYYQKMNITVRIPDNVCLIGRLSHTLTLDAMAACSVYLMTSRHESCPNSLLEAMALGKTVVVPDHSGCKEIVDSPANGFLFSLESVEDAVAAVKSALSNPKVGLNAREHVRQRYDWTDRSKEMDLLYEQLSGK